jgi:hypothetical protein
MYARSKEDALLLGVERGGAAAGASSRSRTDRWSVLQICRPGQASREAKAVGELT